MSAWQKKLDRHLRRLLEEPDGCESVETLMRVCDPLDAPSRAALAKAGVRIHSVVNEILTGTVRLDALRAVAAFDFVARIEMSKPMISEGTD